MFITFPLGSRSAEDVYDACATFDIKLISPELTVKSRAELVLQKTMQLDAAQSQHHMMNEFVELFGLKHNLDEPTLNPLSAHSNNASAKILEAV
jgi:hypothetical protein